jgi:hypothetical protein
MVFGNTISKRLAGNNGDSEYYGLTIGPGKFVKKNKHRALNKRRA